MDTRAFDLEKFPYLEKLYTDPSRKICVEKSAQMGMTVWATLISFHSTWKGLNWLYFFPTARLVSKFVQGRYDVLVSQNPKLKEMIADTDNVTIKRIGNGVIYFSGLGSTTKEGGKFEVISVPVDGVTYDEKELMIPAKVRESKERMAASPYGYEFSVSTPGLPNYGIDLDFQISDQKFLHMKCPHCSSWEVVDDPDQNRFPACIENGYLACSKCGKGLLGYKAHEWVAKKPDNKGMSGYHVSRLYSPFARMDEIFNEYLSLSSTRETKIFYNNVLGFPYVDTAARLSAAMILQMCTQTPFADKIMGGYMGIDVGDNKKGIHIVILKDGPPLYQLCYLEILRAPNAQDPGAIDYIVGQIGRLAQRFGVRRFCIDAQPQPMVSRAVISRFRGKGYMVRYEDNQKGPYKWGKEDEPGEVQVNRTESLDNWHYLLKNRMLGLPIRNPLVEEFAMHSENLVREIEEDEETGAKKATWKKIGPDDFAHACNYAVIASGYNGKPIVKDAPAVVKLTDDPFYRPRQSFRPITRQER